MRSTQYIAVASFTVAAAKASYCATLHIVGLGVGLSTSDNYVSEPMCGVTYPCVSVRFGPPAPESLAGHFRFPDVAPTIGVAAVASTDDAAPPDVASTPWEQLFSAWRPRTVGSTSATAALGNK